MKLPVAVLLIALLCSVNALSISSRIAQTLADEIFSLSDSTAVKKCVKADVLNVRAKPNTSSRIAKTLHNGAAVNVISTSNGWAKIGANQYVANQYLVQCGAKPKKTNGPKPKKTNGPKPSAPTKGGVSLAQLRRIMPGLSAQKANAYSGYLNKAMNEGKVNTCPRKSAFLAQLAHESGQLRYFEEIASGKAYEGRRDLGNTHRGDGVRYKGRGPIQLTGRANYRAAGKALKLPLESNPKMAAQSNVGFRTAIWFWNTHGLNKYADQNSQSGFDRITRGINGGYNGKSNRDYFWKKAKKVLGC